MDGADACIPGCPGAATVYDRSRTCTLSMTSAASLSACACRARANRFIKMPNVACPIAVDAAAAQLSQQSGPEIRALGELHDIHACTIRVASSPAHEPAWAAWSRHGRPATHPAPPAHSASAVMDGGMMHAARWWRPAARLPSDRSTARHRTVDPSAWRPAPPTAASIIIIYGCIELMQFRAPWAAGRHE